MLRAVPLTPSKTEAPPDFPTNTPLVPWSLVPPHFGVWFPPGGYPVESGSLIKYNETTIFK